MWHKLKETFGYRDRPTKITDEKVNERNVVKVSTDQSEINLRKENSSVKEPDNGVLSKTESQSNNEQVPWNLYTHVNESFDTFAGDHENCFGCRVTASVVSLGLVLLFGYRLIKLKSEIPQRKHIFVYTTNLSLFGMWVAFMKKEWYDEKETKDIQKENSG